MDFDFTTDQKALAEAVQRFARDRLADGALARAHDSAYPWAEAKEIAKQGLMGLTIPADKGGQGGTLLDAVIAIEGVAASCPKSADIVQAGNFGAVRTFAEIADYDLRSRFLPRFLAGEGLLGLGMTEPEAGSALTDLTTKATPVPGGYAIDGTKIFSTHSADATAFLVYVRFGPGLDGIGCVLVERDAPGLTIGAPAEFMSGELWCQLYFEDCRIPAENLVIGAGGFRRQISGFNVERIGNSARSLALGRLAFRIARDYALTRRQFGRPLAEFQGLQWKFADMITELDAANLLLYRAAARADRGLPSAYDTAVAKLACNRAGFHAADEAMQVMGGLGFSRETLVEYCLRRTRGWMIAGGSLEMLRNRIAESVFERRFSQRA